MELRKILELANEINMNSIELQKERRIYEEEYRDEIGGHIGYDDPEDRVIGPSDEFLDSLFKECAIGLGFEYECR